jgi:DNA-binding response OmpR family regulator
MKVLLVEDSRRLRISIEQALTHSGYLVQSEEDGEEALWLAENNEYDVIVLDIMLPGLDGFHIIERLRKQGRDTPVLCLTARDALEDRVKGLNTGADDYMVKPFELRELLARVHALCRRKYQAYNDILKVADLELNRETKRVTRGGHEVTLRPREFALLQYLMLRPEQVVARREIDQHLYGDLDAPESNAVDSAICALRRSMAVYPGAPSLIHTRRGQGYVISDPAP